MINPADLPDDIELLKAIVLRQQDQNARLAKLVADFKRALFGAKSEKADPDQYELVFEDIETAIEAIHAERDADVALRKNKQRKSNRGHLPKHLPRVEEVIEPEDTTCTCGAKRHIIGEDTSERLDIIPTQFRVIHCPTGHVYMPEKLDRSTLASWVGKAAYELKPVYECLLANLKQSSKLFMPSRQIAAQSPAG